MAQDLDFEDFIKLIFQTIYIIILIYVGYQILMAIFGGTWETENIIIAGMGIILTGLFVIVGFLIHQATMTGKLDERTKNIGESLSNLGKDFKEHLSKHRS
ncbi:hypothetical protein DRN69_07795 [Candidatus Pacearchaeota archaeon]|nr:MAG: hypothetical protein DRN69_07795 [Candidatus Pacearchaeota archaeon]